MPPQVFCLFHAHSICPVLQIHTVPPQSKSLSYTSDIIFIDISQLTIQEEGYTVHEGLQQSLEDKDDEGSD